MQLYFGIYDYKLHNLIVILAIVMGVDLRCLCKQIYFGKYISDLIMIAQNPVPVMLQHFLIYWLLVYFISYLNDGGFKPTRLQSLLPAVNVTFVTM